MRGETEPERAADEAPQVLLGDVLGALFGEESAQRPRRGGLPRSPPHQRCRARRPALPPPIAPPRSGYGAPVRNASARSSPTTDDTPRGQNSVPITDADRAAERHVLDPHDADLPSDRDDQVEQDRDHHRERRLTDCERRRPGEYAATSTANGNATHSAVWSLPIATTRAPPITNPTAVPARARRAVAPVADAFVRRTDSVPSTTQKPCWTVVRSATRDRHRERPAPRMLLTNQTERKLAWVWAAAATLEHSLHRPRPGGPPRVPPSSSAPRATRDPPAPTRSSSRRRSRGRRPRPRSSGTRSRRLAGKRGAHQSASSVAGSGPKPPRAAALEPVDVGASIAAGEQGRGVSEHRARDRDELAVGGRRVGEVVPLADARRRSATCTTRADRRSWRAPGRWRRARSAGTGSQ